MRLAALGALLVAVYAAAVPVDLPVAAAAAAGFVLAALLARRLVPEPYASAGAALAGLSPAAVAVPPALAAGALLAGATACAAAAREAARVPVVLAGGALLAVLPWLDPWYAIPGAPVAWALYVWCRRARRPVLGLVAAELAVGSLVIYAGVDERLDVPLDPWSAAAAGPRAALWLGWAAIAGLAAVAVWRLWRSRREGVARAIPARATAEATAALALATAAGAVAVGAPAAALPLAGALAAWGLRHAPQAGAALAAATLGLSAWFLLG